MLPTDTIYGIGADAFNPAAVTSLLAAKGAQVTEVEAAFDPALRKEMLERSHGRATYPQIFIGDNHVGGCDELMALDRAGQLDPLLSA